MNLKEVFLKFTLMLKLYKHYLYFPLFSLVLHSCNSLDDNIPKLNTLFFQNLERNSNVKYSKRFSIYNNRYMKVLYLFGSADINDTSATYIIVKDSTIKLLPRKRTHVLYKRCKKIASLSSVYTNMLCELGEINNIIAIENIDYYTNELVLEKYRTGSISELVKAPKMDIEKTIKINPDIVFTFGMGKNEPGVEKIFQANIPVVVTVDHLEETPLARAEWIKFFAAFLNKENLADSIFNSIEKKYKDLQHIASTAQTKPTVFTEIKYGEIWYVPGGKSFAATFIKDAHADYIWNKNTQSGSLHLSFEEVFTKAKNADYWLNMAMINSKAELLAQEKRYSEFKAYKTGQLYNNIKHTNNKGFSDYWETGIAHPERVLSDLILILHPDLKNKTSDDFYYYKKLE